MKTLLIVIGILVALIIWACCRVSGQCARQEEQRIKDEMLGTVISIGLMVAAIVGMIMVCKGPVVY